MPISSAMPVSGGSTFIHNSGQSKPGVGADRATGAAAAVSLRTGAALAALAAAAA